MPAWRPVAVITLGRRTDKTMVAPPPVDLTAASRRLRALASTLRDEASAIAAGQAALEAVRDARADLAQAEGALDLLGSAELRALGKVTEELHPGSYTHLTLPTTPYV